MTDRSDTPRNEVGQKPSRTPKETEERLEEKARDQRGGANKVRTEEQIDDVHEKASRMRS